MVIGCSELPSVILHHRIIGSGSFVSPPKQFCIAPHTTHHTTAGRFLAHSAQRTLYTDTTADKSDTTLIDRKSQHGSGTVVSHVPSSLTPSVPVSRPPPLLLCWLPDLGYHDDPRPIKTQDHVVVIPPFPSS